MPNSIVSMALAAALAVTAGAASAHPILRSSSPPANGLPGSSPLKVPPNAVVLVFSEAIVAPFSGVTLTDDHGRSAATGKAATTFADAERLVIPLVGTLTPGRYRVDWHAVARDTHRVTGQFAFTVAK